VQRSIERRNAKTALFLRCTLCVTASAALVSCGVHTSGLPTAVATGTSQLRHHTFNYTGKAQTFKVPAGVSEIDVVARGAAGAGKTYFGHETYYGRGGRVHATIPVRPGERFTFTWAVNLAASTAEAAAQPPPVAEAGVAAELPTYDRAAKA